MAAGYRTFEHTADAGVAARAARLPRLFEVASGALFDLICDRRRVRPARRVRLAVRGAGLEDLLVRWLSELLYRRETEDWLFSRFAVERVDRARCLARGVAMGERYDPARHAVHREVKAITYHQMRLERRGGIWRVRIIFDV